MRRNGALMGMMLAVCSLGIAQDAGNERVVVPARNSTHSRKIDVNLMGGSITVKAYNGKEVIVEATDSGDREKDKEKFREDRRADGLRRLDVGRAGLSVEEQDNVVTVRMQSGHRGSSVTIQTPADAALTLRTMGGAIEVEGVKGEMDINSMNGRITLNHVSGSVLAHSMNGGLMVVMDAVDQSKPLSFSTMNGMIDVTLPVDFKSNVKLRTDHGEIYSDFDFKLSGGAITQKNDSSDGKFRVKMDKTITGTINGGGTESTFTTFNGAIYIRKRK